MRIKSLEIRDFKSFADRQIIYFSEGVTCIVGSNGAGKSNIIDAIKYVLGADETRSLRVPRMQELVFNGTPYRKSAEYCEVSITFSDVPKTQFATKAGEVKITRRTHCKNDTYEYYINDKKCTKLHKELRFYEEIFKFYEEVNIDDFVFVFEQGIEPNAIQKGLDNLSKWSCVIFDETDNLYPVDDFAELMKELKNGGKQAIVTTHNKSIMKIADGLYGIVMREIGVSRFAGVTLNKTGKLEINHDLYKTAVGDKCKMLKAWADLYVAENLNSDAEIEEFSKDLE